MRKSGDTHRPGDSRGRRRSPLAIRTTGSTENGLRIAKAIQNKLSEMRPADAAYFAQRYASFEQRLSKRIRSWLTEMKPYAGRKIVTYTLLAELRESISISCGRLR